MLKERKYDEALEYLQNNRTNVTASFDAKMKEVIKTEIIELGIRSKIASKKTALLSSEAKNNALKQLILNINKNKMKILESNKIDLLMKRYMIWRDLYTKNKNKIKII